MAFTQKLNSGKYRGRYRDDTRRLRSTPTFIRKSDAQRAAAEQERALRIGTWVDPKMRNMPFSDFASDFLDTRSVRIATRNRDGHLFTSHILPTFGNYTISGITRKDIKTWLKSLTTTSHLSPRSARDCYGVMRLIMKEAEIADYIHKSPCHDIELPKSERVERKFLTADQVETLADSMDARYRTGIFLCAYLGLRWEEFAAIKRERVNILKRELAVVAVIERDGSACRYTEDLKTEGSLSTLALPDFLTDLLRTQIETCGDDFIFPAPTGGHLAYNNFRCRFWLPAIKRAGLAPLGFHALRHTAAALMIKEGGANLLAVQRRMRHTDIKTTLGQYGHLYPDQNLILTQRLNDVRHGAHMAHKEAKPGHS